MKIKAIIFDLDGLLLDSEPVAMRAMGRAIFERTGKEMTFAFFRELIGHSRSDTYPNFEREYGFDVATTNAVRDRTAELIVEAIKRGECEKKPYCDETFDFLDAKGTLRMVASSSPRSQIWQKLKMQRLSHRVNAIVSGWEVPRSKPDPAIFLKASELIETPPEECLVLEDSPAGVTAASRAGMPCIMIPDLIAPSAAEKAQAFLVLPSLKEAVLELEKML